MLGLNKNGNDWKFILGNFAIFLFAAIIFELGELLILNRFPSAYECYEALVKALIATFAVYGINRATHKEK